MQLRNEGNQEFLYLATTSQHKVVKTTLDGEQVFVLNYPKDAKNSHGKLYYEKEERYNPTNIAFAPNGDFYVADGYGLSYVHRYGIQGEYISTFGGIWHCRWPIESATRHLVRHTWAGATNSCRGPKERTSAMV